ncbi:AfsR/SARP family transcriptional regulator [Sphaerisporangium sp. TRM90804]|uniref:AfsR/SARP family transcriptional regulator n=1 Tax=Sphaerisporangium sp. TRM90804 TaxID=3031113 RepID=UPI00244CA2B5|nr:AfsR/SARP family transcriptional regulator [Sphaerisporangium sp. TRM90804]MDH2426172.1 BTAD domain-containing putative transcriptional regulator [Sphaerisporangium sp. TRM90804]
MEFRVLGSLQVVDGSCDLTPSAAKVRAVLAMLVLRHNQIVSTRELIDELWGERPPATALATLHTYVYKLRKMIGTGGPASVVTKPYGYLLATSPETIDVYRFERLVADGWSALERDEPEHATDALFHALALWRGPALSNLAAGELLSAQITRLEESRLRALQLRLDADLRLGRHRELISELKELIATHPLNEDFYAKLMTALYQSGRRGEALEVYQNLRQVLVGQLGLEPSPALCRLQQRLLSANPGLEHPGPEDPGLALREIPPRAPVQAPAPKAVRPAQLPPDIADFVGRGEVGDRIAATLAHTAHSGTAVRVICISGMPGVGETTLAVHAAHRARPDFPSGQFYAQLDGPGGGSDPGQVLAGFLLAAGMPPERIPADRDERSKLFRTWCSDRQVLIVLDDATGGAQIQPLLPGSPGCAVIVTSRSGLHGFAGAHVVELEPLSPGEGLELLGRIIGPERLEAERAAAERIVHLCGGLPLALRCAGSRLAASQGLTLASLAERLRDPRARLDNLCAAGLDVRAAFRAAYERLPDPERGLFRLLGLLRTPHVTVRQAGALLGCDPGHAERLLAGLAATSLLTAEPGPSDEIRHTIHDLLALYARESLDHELDAHLDPAPDRPATGAAAAHPPIRPVTLPAPAERVNGTATRVLGP